jgi:SAM-dependent methyltransferase
VPASDDAARTRVLRRRRQLSLQEFARGLLGDVGRVRLPGQVPDHQAALNEEQQLVRQVIRRIGPRSVGEVAEEVAGLGQVRCSRAMHRVGRSVGHRTGLFDAMAAMEPATSVEIAAKASRDERYVREWLGGMVASRIVDYEPETGRYALPAEHAAFLTRDAAPNNIAAFAQYTAVLGSVEDRIVDCFEKGGGVPYSAYDRFHEVMAEDSGQTVVPALIDAILPLVPGLTEKLEQGIDVLDVGCGSGRALNLMARRFPRSRFTGWDLCEDAVEAARAQANGTPNLSFEVRDLTGFDRDDEAEEGFDLVTAFDAVHDQKSPDALLRGVRRAVREDGAFLMQDIRASTRVERNVEHPIGPLLYAISTMHCMTVSLAGPSPGCHRPADRSARSADRAPRAARVRR